MICTESGGERAAAAAGPAASPQRGPLPSAAARGCHRHGARPGAQGSPRPWGGVPVPGGGGRGPVSRSRPWLELSAGARPPRAGAEARPLRAAPTCAGAPAPEGYLYLLASFLNK